MGKRKEKVEKTEEASEETHTHKHRIGRRAKEKREESKGRESQPTRLHPQASGLIADIVDPEKTNWAAGGGGGGGRGCMNRGGVSGVGMGRLEAGGNGEG